MAMKSEIVMVFPVITTKLVPASNVRLLKVLDEKRRVVLPGLVMVTNPILLYIFPSLINVPPSLGSPIIIVEVPGIIVYS